MLVVIQRHNAHDYPHLLDQMFRLRARVFQEKLNWDVVVTAGLECDRYDDEDPVYVLICDEEATQVRGSLRLLPTTGPTLLSEVFGETLPDPALLTAPSIWECTRFCVDDRLLKGEPRAALVHESGVLFAGLGEVALANGIRTVLGNFDAGMYRLYRRAGVEVEILGSAPVNGQAIYLGSFPVSEEILHRVKTRLDNPERQLARAAGRRPLAA